MPLAIETFEKLEMEYLLNLGKMKGNNLHQEMECLMKLRIVVEWKFQTRVVNIPK